MPTNLHELLLIGAGGIGRRHAEAFAKTGRVRVSVCEPDAGRRVAVTQSGWAARAFSSLADALAAQRWDAAVVASPAHTHMPIARQVTQARIPLLLEKPLAVTAEGAVEWVRDTERAGLPVMVGYVFRCHPLLEALRAEIQAGRVGKVVQLTIQRGGHLPSRRPDYVSTYYANPAQGGGVVHDILSHLYNAAEWLAGPIRQVSAQAAHCCLPGVEVADTVHAIARHEDGVMASYALNQHQYVAEFSLQVNGTDGSLRADFHEHRLLTAQQPDGKWEARSFPAVSNLDWFVLQANRFLDVVEGRATVPCSASDALRTLEAILATIQSSSRNGEPVAISPS